MQTLETYGIDVRRKHSPLSKKLLFLRVHAELYEIAPWDARKK